MEARLQGTWITNDGFQLECVVGLCSQHYISTAGETLLMNNFAYTFMWQGDLHIGVPLPNEKSELTVHAPESIEVEIGENLIESGQAVVPVRFHNKTGKAGKHRIEFEFEG